MKLEQVETAEQLWEFMTEPSAPLIESMRKIEGPMVVLGGSGKMGKELVGLVQRADRAHGVQRRVTVASTFSNPASTDLADFAEMGVDCLKGDLSDEAFLGSLPDAPNVVYMMGFKFGSNDDWRRAFHLNSIVPYLVGQKYPKSRIVVFSSGNPYPHTEIDSGGCSEIDALAPIGIYGWSIVARESSFRTTAMQNGGQKVSLYRLMYAQHLAYGVLVDLANMLLRDEPISLVAMPAVNLVSQRDANEVAIRCLERCDNPPWAINVAGPAWPVRKIVERLAKRLSRRPRIIGEEKDTALLANDTRCRQVFGEYRDDCEEMMDAVARWVWKGGKSWNKPTHFGKVKHDY
jgi:nucleoside-diphosphate-sugar epimerase